MDFGISNAGFYKIQSAISDFKYGVPLRPIGFATVPEGYIGIEEHPKFSHGVVVYNESLSEEQINSFELVPLVDMDKIINFISEDLSEYAEEYIELYEEEPRQFEMIVGSRFEEMNVYPEHEILDRQELSNRVLEKLKQTRME